MKERQKLYDCIEDKIKTITDASLLLEKYDTLAYRAGAISMAEHYQVTVVSALFRKSLIALTEVRKSLDEIPAK